MFLTAQFIKKIINVTVINVFHGFIVLKYSCSSIILNIFSITRLKNRKNLSRHTRNIFGIIRRYCLYLKVVHWYTSEWLTKDQKVRKHLFGLVKSLVFKIRWICVGCLEFFDYVFRGRSFRSLMKFSDVCRSLVFK